MWINLKCIILNETQVLQILDKFGPWISGLKI